MLLEDPRPSPAHDLDATEAPEPASSDVDDEDAAPGRRRKAVGRFAIRTLMAVTIGFTLLSIYLFTHRGRVTDLLAAIPVVGTELSRETPQSRARPAHRRARHVRARPRRCAGVRRHRHGGEQRPGAGERDRDPGRASTAPGSSGGWCSPGPHRTTSTISRRTRSISCRRSGRHTTGGCSPGEDGEFLVAFVDPPVPLKEFSAEVVAVQRGERHGVRRLATRPSSWAARRARRA